jgi:hypothetical protein
MSDTIDLLDAIGQDASLRHASADDLSLALDRANASDTLKAAVATGDSSLLTSELGFRLNQVPQVTNAPGHEEEPEQDEKTLPNRQPNPDKTKPHGH